MCLICDRIKMIKDGTNPYFVKELETGYVVIGDNQHFKGYTLFLHKKHKTELFQLDLETKKKFLEEMRNNIHGELSEWSKVQHSKCCVPKRNLGFESLTLRQKVR